MLRLLVLSLLLASLTRLAAAPSSDAPRHYTGEQWQAIKARFIDTPRPDYYESLRRRHITGSGAFRLYIDAQGRVTQVKILQSTGHRELDATATAAFRNWRAKPGPAWDLDVPATFAMTQR